MIKAEMILASASAHAKPLFTLKLKYPQFIHAELMTHRMLSKNCSSNRAIPLSKMIKEATTDRQAVPVKWGTEQKGMSPGNELPDYGIYDGVYKSPRMEASIIWARAGEYAAYYTEQLAKLGVHKSICNRLLMPFTHHNTIITGTEWENFFGLRLDKAADPTMRALAEAIWIEINEAKPVKLEPGQWHLPFADCVGVDWNNQKQLSILTKVSVARCARVSYESFETGKTSTIEEDLKLYNKLVTSKPAHLSPTEHQASPDFIEEYCSEFTDTTWKSRFKYPVLHGNLIGWCQYRKMIPGEAVAPLPEGYTYAK